MALSFSPGSLARASARHPWRVIGIWAVGIVVAFVLVGALLEDALTTEARATNNPDSAVGEKLLEERLRGPFRAQEAIVVQSPSLTVDDPAFQAKVGEILAEVRALGPDVIEGATSFYETNFPNFVSVDRHSTFIAVTMAGEIDEANTNVAEVIDIVKARDGAEGFNVLISGFATVNHDFTEAAERDLARSEYGPLPLAFIILVLVFGAIIAALVPIVLAILAILTAVALVAVFGTNFEFSFFVVNMIVMMGLAVGIDYSLFILSRYREELSKGHEKIEAISIAGGTAGRAVFFSGITVIIALLGLLIIPHTIFRSLASGAIFVVAVSVIASLTMLPAILSLLGGWVNKPTLRDLVQFPRRIVRPGFTPTERIITLLVTVLFVQLVVLAYAIHGVRLLVERIRRKQGTQLSHTVQHAQQAYDEQATGGFWDRIARGVMARPVVSLVLGAGLLLAAAVPFLDINLGGSGVSSLPDSFISKQGFLVLESEFRGGDVSPVEIVIDGDVNSPAVQTAIEDLKAAVATEPVLGAAAFQSNQAGDLGLLTFQLSADSFSDDAVDAVKRLRSDYIPAAFGGVDARVYVTGLSAVNLDAYQLTDQYTPIVFIFVLGLSFILLMIVFRSLVVPIKSIILNLLSVGAAYGLLVLVFQKGFLNGVLGFQQVEAIEAWLPLFLFAVLFGLSMDYHVFLLSRIRERYDQIHDNTESVAFGLRSTGRLITGAALIMVAVFGGFALGDLVMMQQMGFGLGVSVFLDATIVRSVLVPASMKLLGDKNWYLPPILGWLPHIGIEGAPAVPQPALTVQQPEPVSAGGGS